ncbi:MAG: threonine--tRNA ligase [Leptospirillia bacterium]
MSDAAPPSPPPEILPPGTPLDVLLGGMSGKQKKRIVAAMVDGRQVDLFRVFEQPVEAAGVTWIEADSEDGLEVMRHSTSHLMAQAVKELFPTAQVTIGPAIDDGFYYDFDYERPFTEDDLVAIESRMRELTRENTPVERIVMPRDEAVALFEGMGEHYKAEIIGDLPADEEITVYRQGDFMDLCRGPHVPSTGRLGAFRLLRVSGAYWRGDSNNPMLQRVYGTAWANDKDLKAYLKRLDEAEKRDHRRLAKALDLFHLQEEAPGMVFWHPKGWTLWQEVESYIRELIGRHGYQEIRTPQLVDRQLWEKSGHWGKFRDHMFTTLSEERDYAVKPMNCPCHVQVFNQGLRSYRDLPLRLAEFGSCHRHEPSGTLHGLMRVRAFTQDDAHIFCTEAQIADEVGAFIKLLFEAYKTFGFTDIEVLFSDRPEERVGSDEVWDRAESALKAAMDKSGVAYGLNPGEGAFYGPKIEFSLRDCLGRVWQCGTIQVDFSMPGRLDASYVDADDVKKTPVMLHRAIVGSMERFIGILIEHYAGDFPTWLTPVQARLLPIADRHHDYVRGIEAAMREQGIRVESDLRNEKVGFKIREAQLSKVPFMLVVGDREAESGTVALRTRSEGDVGERKADEVIAAIAEEIRRRA